MDPNVQWGITVIVGILTFLGGRAFERRKLANANRLKLLIPIEEWLDKASQLIGIIGDDLSAISQGLALPIGYSIDERLEASKSMGEGKEKVIGILRSKALSTTGTKRTSARLYGTITQLDEYITRRLFPQHFNLLEKMGSKPDLTGEIDSVALLAGATKEIIQEAHSLMAQLKTRFN